MSELQKILDAPSGCKIGTIADGYHIQVLADLARGASDAGQGNIVFIARDGARMAAARRALTFFAPQVKVLELPAWDCLPYDRSPPHISVSATRMATLARLASLQENTPQIILTTIAAAAQKLPPRDVVQNLCLTLRAGQVARMDNLLEFLSGSGYQRCSNVLEVGEYAVRGGIVDLFPPSALAPIRLDFFGDKLESLHHFAPDTQRRGETLTEIEIVAASEIELNAKTIKNFRQNYVQSFGAATPDDALYQAVSAGARHYGMEHWTPLFYARMESLFEHLPQDTLYLVDTQADDVYQNHIASVQDYYEARKQAKTNPLPPQEFYLLPDAWAAALAKQNMRFFSAFDGDINLPSKPAQDFSGTRKQSDKNLFAEVAAHIKTQQHEKHIVIVGWSEGSAERLSHVLQENGLPALAQAQSWEEVQALPRSQPALAAFGLERGFETPQALFISEQDIMGERIGNARQRSKRRGKRSADFISEIAQLSVNDYVVHIEHGIGQFQGLETLTLGGAPHDCLRLLYGDDTRLFLPVENIDLLSRYGGDDSNVALDKIGGVAWQTRKARLREKLKMIAADIIKTAALRATRSSDKLAPDVGLYDEFCARFAHDETEDQLSAIEAVLEDLQRGQPMDRLICGDVGFGKTEVALRAAFIAVMGGKQVALVAPTTLLARQHTATFTERFAGMPVRIAHLSRLVGGKEAAQAREAAADGVADIIIGTHALLSNKIKFADLGLVIVDEEQHFGVAHKERLKNLRAETHFLTLSATPIPRTLQMALSGVRDLSLIATPPVDRLAVRTYVSPFDEIVLREALLREKYRGGQSFFVVPRIADIETIAAFLREHVSEVKFIIAHGQMSPKVLEEAMLAFYNGDYDILLSTSIIESGLDIPSANTIIIHRADMFGLAQLYQMRGRVGRSKQRAYAYLTYEERRVLTEQAHKRLTFMQSLDSLGAGFHLASYDLDLRGAGNIVGEAQSGHLREVGVELYHAMLEEAVAEQQGGERESGWSPQINLGLSVLLPDDYVPDLDLRMQLYRRLSRLQSAEEIDDFGAELTDRFGTPPAATKHLLDVVKIKLHCVAAGIDKIDVGDKGLVVAFRHKAFANPRGLIDYITDNPQAVKLRPDQTLLFPLQGGQTKTGAIPIIMSIVQTLATLATK